MLRIHDSSTVANAAPIRCHVMPEEDWWRASSDQDTQPEPLADVEDRSLFHALIGVRVWLKSHGKAGTIVDFWGIATGGHPVWVVKLPSGHTVFAPLSALGLMSDVRPMPLAAHLASLDVA
jgi:hypothetical protein